MDSENLFQRRTSVFHVISSGNLKNLLMLELEIFQQGNEIDEEEIRKFQDRLISFHKIYTNALVDLLDNDFSCLDRRFQERVHHLEYVEKKINRMRNWLRKFIEPVNKSASSIELKVNDDQSNVNNQTHTVNLNSLVQKQKFYIQMIDSLAPDGEISSKEAELQYAHVSQFYEKFVSNQSEISTFVKDDAFDDLLNISKEVHGKVLSLQKTLKEIFSPTKLIIEEFNRIDRPNVTVESKNDSSAVEIETMRDYDQLYDTFIRNQGEIETYVKSTALDKEIEISREILVKMVSLYTMLKEIFAPIESPSLTKSKAVDESNQMKKSDQVIYLNSLREKQKSMIDEIELMPLDKQLDNYFGELHEPKFHDKKKVKSLSLLLSKIKVWFLANQTKIEELVEDFDLHQQKKISEKFQDKLAGIEKQYEFYLNRCANSNCDLIELERICWDLKFGGGGFSYVRQF